MRFRAKMFETLSMKNLATISNILSKLSKTTILKIDPTTMSFMIYDDNSSPKQAIVWCILQAHQFFNEYLAEGPSETNEIYLDLPTDMLSSSLSLLRQGTMMNTRSVKIKLTDKISPCITVEMEFVSEFSTSRSCVHDIPVRIIPRCEWCQYTDPFEKDYPLVLELKNLKKLRSVVESLKKLCPHIAVSGSSEGNLTVEADAQTASVKTIFQNLRVVKAPETDGGSFGVRVDVKKLHQLLLCEQLGPRQVNCEIFPESVIHFHLNLDSLTFHFYLPSIDE